MAEVNLTLGDPIEVKVAPAEGATNVTVSPAPLNVVQVQAAIATNALAGPAGPGIPSGGTENQFIQKGDGGEFDTKFSAYTLPGVDGDEKQVFVANGDGTTSWDYVESTFLQVENAESSAISAGTVVYAFGVSGNNITVKKADASASSTMPAIGIVLEEIAAGSAGEIITSGLFNKTISGLSSISVGDTVYVSETAGEVTTTKPTGTALIQNIGIVLKTNGDNIQKMKVSAIDRVNDLPNIPNGQAWIGNSNGVPTPTTLAAVATSGSYNDLSNTPSITDTNTTYSVSTANGDVGSEKKIVLTGSDSTTDDVVLKAGQNIALTRDGEKILISNNLTDTNTEYSFLVADGVNSDEEIIRLRPNNGSGDQDVILEAGTGLSITNDSNNKITFTNTSSSTDTNLGSNDLTLSENRTLDMSGHSLAFENSSVEKAKIFSTGTATFTGRVTVDGNDVVGGSIRLKEADGTSLISLQAPTNLSGNVSLTLPSADGSNGQVLQTDGSGGLSFVSLPSSLPKPLTTLTGRFQFDADDDNRTIVCGSISFGTNYFLWNTELFNTVTTGTVDTTTQSISNREAGLSFRVPETAKVRWDFLHRPGAINQSVNYRAQIWSISAFPETPSAQSAWTLRADEAFTSGSSNQGFLEDTVTTTSQISAGDYLLFVIGMNDNISSTHFLTLQSTVTLVP